MMRIIILSLIGGYPDLSVTFSALQLRGGSVHYYRNHHFKMEFIKFLLNFEQIA